MIFHDSETGLYKIIAQTTTENKITTRCAALCDRMEDAVLFDAAPELLEALKILLVQLGPYIDGQGAAKFHAVNIANEAITKATGDA